jgi:hypothetical protein
MLSRIKRGGQRFFLEEQGGIYSYVNGVQDISIDYKSTMSSFSVLGSKKTFYSPTSPQTAVINVNSLLFYNDPFYAKLFTSDGFNGKLEYKKEGLLFEDAHLISYSSSCSIGEIPSISMQADVYGELLKSETKEPFDFSYNDSFKVAGYNSIELELDDVFKTNRVQNYSLSASAKRKPIYSYNSKKPEEVSLIGPLQFSVNFTIEIDDYEIENMRNIEKSSFFKNVRLTINENSSENQIQFFEIEDAIIESEKLSASVDGSAVLNLSLIGNKSLEL